MFRVLFGAYLLEPLNSKGRGKTLSPPDETFVGAKQFGGMFGGIFGERLVQIGL